MPTWGSCCVTRQICPPWERQECVLPLGLKPRTCLRVRQMCKKDVLHPRTTYYFLPMDSTVPILVKKKFQDKNYSLVSFTKQQQIFALV